MSPYQTSLAATWWPFSEWLCASMAILQIPGNHSHRHQNSRQSQACYFWMKQNKQLPWNTELSFEWAVTSSLWFPSLASNWRNPPSEFIDSESMPRRIYPLIERVPDHSFFVSLVTRTIELILDWDTLDGQSLVTLMSLFAVLTKSLKPLDETTRASASSKHEGSTNPERIIHASEYGLFSFVNQCCLTCLLVPSLRGNEPSNTLLKATGDKNKPAASTSLFKFG